MVEPETARAGLEALTAAIAEMSEDLQDRAVRPARGGGKGKHADAIALQRLGEDVAALAAAMEVLHRRSG